MAIKRVIRNGCSEFQKCEEIIDGEIVTCPKFMSLGGKDPQTGESLPDEWKCAEVWQVIVGLEGNNVYRGTRQAVESMRDETIKRQDAFIGLAHQARLSRDA